MGSTRALSFVGGSICNELNSCFGTAYDGLTRSNFATILTTVAVAHHCVSGFVINNHRVNDRRVNNSWIPSDSESYRVRFSGRFQLLDDSNVSLAVTIYGTIVKCSHSNTVARL